MEEEMKEEGQQTAELAETAKVSEREGNSLVLQSEPQETAVFPSYQKVLRARSKDRPGIRTYIGGLFTDFVELHGDRLYRDDPSLIGGIGLFHGTPVTVIGQVKGKTTTEQIACNFGMTSPEGYRKARRLMEQAEKFHRPVITLIDTPGAYPGKEAEENGQSAAIAESIAYMSRMSVPSIAVITGEGSSGGALALALADRVYMLEDAVYAILSPEGFASILWKDAGRAPEASEVMKLTARELLERGLIDGIVPEYAGYETDPAPLIRRLDEALTASLRELTRMNPKALVRARYQRYRRIDGLYGR